MFNTLTFPETMEEFIERYKVVKGEKNLYCEGVEFIPVFRMKEWIERIQPRKGEWINVYPDIEPNPMFMYGICSVCGYEQAISDKLNFCPNCGADMREGDTE